MAIEPTFVLWLAPIASATLSPVTGETPNALTMTYASAYQRRPTMLSKSINASAHDQPRNQIHHHRPGHP